MKRYLFTLVAIAVLGAGELTAQEKKVEEPAQLKALKLKYEIAKEKALRAVNQEHIERLGEMEKTYLRNGNPAVAKLIRDEIESLEIETAKTDLLKLMEGTWRWNTKSEFSVDAKGQPATEEDHTTIYVLDARARKVLIRPSLKWQYEAIVAEDGKSFTARGVYTERGASGKKISK